MSVQVVVSEFRRNLMVFFSALIVTTLLQTGHVKATNYLNVSVGSLYSISGSLDYWLRVKQVKYDAHWQALLTGRAPDFTYDEGGVLDSAVGENFVTYIDKQHRLWAYPLNSSGQPSSGRILLADCDAGESPNWSDCAVNTYISDNTIIMGYYGQLKMKNGLNGAWQNKPVGGYHAITKTRFLIDNTVFNIPSLSAQNIPESAMNRSNIYTIKLSGNRIAYVDHDLTLYVQEGNNVANGWRAVASGVDVSSFLVEDNRLCATFAYSGYPTYCKDGSLSAPWKLVKTGAYLTDMTDNKIATVGIEPGNRGRLMLLEGSLTHNSGWIHMGEGDQLLLNH